MGLRDWFTRRYGFSDKSTLDFVAKRETVYRQFFGGLQEVNHELNPVVPHIDVYVYPPGFQGRDFFTLVTGGLSDFPMDMPPGPTSPRCELIMYAREPAKRCIGFLRYLACIPHVQNTWFSHGSTMTNGQPPEPIFEGSQLDCVLFLFPIVSPDKTIGEHLLLEGQAVNFLWIVPVTNSECELVRHEGLGKMLALMDQNNHPIVLNTLRASYA